MVRVLALSGKRFAGKDTLVAAVVAAGRARGVAVAVHAFADESKRMFAALQRGRGALVDEVRLRTDRAYKERWRPQLTAFTMAALRVDPLVFCRAVADRVAAAAAPCAISDLRLRGELEHLRARFAVHVVRVTRPDALRAASGWRHEPAADEHPTETELDDSSLWDEEVRNDGTLAQLAALVATRFDAWLG